MELIFLGTSCMVPTKERNHQGILLLYKGEGILFDCGEGIQRQIKSAGEKMTKIRKIFLSHWHGDHVLGLPGLMQTMESSDYEGELHIYGPVETKKRLEHMFKAFSFQPDWVVAHEIDDISLDFDAYTVTCKPLEHGIPCLGYRFDEKPKRRMNMSKLRKLGISEGPLVGELQGGLSVTHKGNLIAPDEVSTIMPGKSFAVILDSRPTKNMSLLAKNVDILISEATYANEHALKAEEYMHMTAAEAGQVASMAGAKKLFITHFSQRYKEPDVLLSEARDIFPNTIAAHDLMKVRV